MSDKIWTVIYVVLSCIIVVLLCIVMITSNAPSKVNCDGIAESNSSNNYKPLPKQCQKGEK